MSRPTCENCGSHDLDEKGCSARCRWQARMRLFANGPVATEYAAAGKALDEHTAQGRRLVWASCHRHHDEQRSALQRRWHNTWKVYNGELKRLVSEEPGGEDLDWHTPPGFEHYDVIVSYASDGECYYRREWETATGEIVTYSAHPDGLEGEWEPWAEQPAFDDSYWQTIERRQVYSR